MAALHHLTLTLMLAGPDATAGAPPEAGRDSFADRLDIGRDGTMACCVRVAGGLDAEAAIREWPSVSPTRIDDRDGVPVPLKAVRRFEQELRRGASPGKP